MEKRLLQYRFDFFQFKRIDNKLGDYLKDSKKAIDRTRAAIKSGALNESISFQDTLDGMTSLNLARQRYEALSRQLKTSSFQTKEFEGLYEGLEEDVKVINDVLVFCEDYYQVKSNYSIVE